MSSLDYQFEKRQFRLFYDKNRSLFEEAKNGYVEVISNLLTQANVAEVTKIEGRVKDREECIKKFQRKYLNSLEADERAYEIKSYLSDLIGIRIVCLYEDQISAVSEVLKSHFKIIDVTDKIAAIESTEDLFGYKGLHMDMACSEEMAASVQYSGVADQFCEVQIRSLIQDAWSVLDHKIKYKKSIPNNLKRRINVLSALFELADREFKEIRNATMQLIQQETVSPVGVSHREDGLSFDASSSAATEKSINVFSFLRVAGHFFNDFEFEDHRVDNFVQVILKADPTFEKSDLHQGLIENLKMVREYRDQFILENPENTFSPYTMIRHCLYLYRPATFERILSKWPRERFDEWRSN